MSQMALYLFGDNDPRITCLMLDPSFKDLVRGFFAADAVAVPAFPGPALATALDLGLLVVEGAVYKPSPKLVVIPAVAERELPELLRPTLAHYVEIASDTTSDLRSAFAQSMASERFTWQQVSHTLVAGTFLDLAMGVALFHSGLIEHRPIGDSVLWAFETVSAQNAFGVQWRSAAQQRAFLGQLWHRGLKREEIRLKTSFVDLLVKVARGELVDRNSKELLYLRYLKLVRASGSSLQVQIPFFGRSDVEILLAVLAEGGRRLVEDAILPAVDSLAGNTWWRERVRHENCRHAAVRLILEYGTDRVIASKVLEPFPKQPDLFFEWGRWLWDEPEGEATLMPSVASRQGTVAA